MADQAQDRINPLLWIDLLSVRGFFVLLGVAVLLCWPMLIVEPPIAFFDTDAYHNRGFQIFAFIGEMLPFAGDAATNGAAGGAAAIPEGGARSLRSIPYSVFAYATQSTPLGYFGTAVTQTVLVLLMLGGAIGRLPLLLPQGAVPLFLACVFLTSLPWFASFIMPDMFAAAIILYAVVLVSQFDELSWTQRIVLALIAAAAIMCHYGHILLAVGAFGSALGLRLLQWRLGASVLAFGIAPLVLAVLANTLFSMVAFQSTSVAPKRLPILLARSMEDGPARWHLQEHCKTYNYAICEILGEIPETVSGLLFEDSGLRKATAEQMDKVRQEEPVILLRALQEYPVEQVGSMLYNSFDQFVSFGLEDFGQVRLERLDNGRVQFEFTRDLDRTVFVAFNVIHVSVLVLTLLVIGVMFYRRQFRPEDKAFSVYLVILATLLANAVIYGGLSEPADRYQTRLVWVVPVLTAVFWLRRKKA